MNVWVQTAVFFLITQLSASSMKPAQIKSSVREIAATAENALNTAMAHALPTLISQQPAGTRRTTLERTLRTYNPH